MRYKAHYLAVELEGLFVVVFQNLWNMQIIIPNFFFLMIKML